MLPLDLLEMLNNPDTPNFAIKDALEERGINVAEVYIVVGQTGEYSRYRGWYIAAYLDNDTAIQCRDKLNTWCKENNCADNQYGNWHYLSEVERHKICPLDPSFNSDYNGTLYTVISIELKG